MRRVLPSPPPPDRVQRLLSGVPTQGPEETSPPAAPRDDDVGAAVAPVAPAAPAAEPGRRARGGMHRASRRSEPAVFTLPGSLRRAVIRPAWAAVLGAALVGLVAVAILGGRAVLAQVNATPTPVLASERASADVGSALAGGSAAPPPGGPGDPGAGAGAATGSASGVVVVHVVGRVRTPGVVRLAPGARIEDAVAAAGGALPDAELRVVNLARPITDGEQLVVPEKGSAEASAAEASAAEASAAAGGAAVAGPSRAAPGGGSGATARVDLNTADEAALDTLPGVGPVTARRILEWRATHGAFSRVEELAEVPGIGPKLLAQLTPLVRV